MLAWKGSLFKMFVRIKSLNSSKLKIFSYFSLLQSFGTLSQNFFYFLMYFSPAYLGHCAFLGLCILALLKYVFYERKN